MTLIFETLTICFKTTSLMLCALYKFTPCAP